MNLTLFDFLGAAGIGLGATLIMDSWAIFSRRYLGVAPPNYCLVGRWFSHMLEGRWRHHNIARSASMPAECAVGWLSHYAIGAMYGVVLVTLTFGEWLLHPTIGVALVFGIATLIFPFLLMQPSFGFGFFSAKTANPRQARLKSVMAHTAFGIGLYVSGMLFNTLTALVSQASV